MKRTITAGKYRDTGLLILRIGLGIMFISHGYPKVFGGPEIWIKYGEAMQYLGINFTPMLFGFAAGIAEFFGGIFLILGLFFIPSNILLFLVMGVATAKHIATGDGFASLSHSIELGIIFFSLIFIGPGRKSLDHKLVNRP